MFLELSLSDFPLAQPPGVFVGFDRCGKSLGATGHYELNCFRSHIESWRALGRVERSDASTSACADVDQTASLRDSIGDQINCFADLRKSGFHRGRDLRIFSIDDLRDFE